MWLLPCFATTHGDPDVAEIAAFTSLLLVRGSFCPCNRSAFGPSEGDTGAAASPAPSSVTSSAAFSSSACFAIPDSSLSSPISEVRSCPSTLKISSCRMLVASTSDTNARHASKSSSSRAIVLGGNWRATARRAWAACRNRLTGRSPHQDRP